MAFDNNTSNLCATLENSGLLGQNLIQSASTSTPHWPPPNKPPNLFEELLNKCTPSEWHKKINYLNKNYTYFQLHSQSEEYNRIKDEFKNNCKCSQLKLKKIERIQHPFAYFSFLVRCQQIRDMCKCEPQVERIFIPLKWNLFDNDLISYNGDFRRIKENSRTKRGYVVVVMKILIDYKCGSYPIIYEEVKDHEKYPEYLITLDEDASNAFDIDDVIDVDNYPSDSSDKLDSNCLCISKYLEDFSELFDVFTDTKGEVLLNSFKYPVQHYLYHVTSNCKCSKCILSCFPNHDPKMPLPFICTENNLKFWNIVLNY